MLAIDTLIKESYATAKAKGWHDQQATFGDRIALIHSELSEALEEFRNHRDPAELYHGPDGKPEGPAAELADVIIRVCDMCGLYEIDLVSNAETKLAYNRTRPFHHGGKAL